VTLSTSEISGKKTIIVVWWNFSITNNMYYSNPSQDILWIVVLKDDAWNGGNLYVDPSVTNIVGTIVLDKSLISYNGTELDGNADASILANQLHIFGNLYSENTIGWSRSTPLKCPFYRTCLTQEEAQKYDLNYTRRFSINSNWVPSNSGKLIGGATCTPNPSPADPTCIWGSSLYKGYYTTLPNTASEHPLIIEYNSLLGTVAPPLFSK
jgi:hypothetical protein